MKQFILCIEDINVLDQPNFLQEVYAIKIKCYIKLGEMNLAKLMICQLLMCEILPMKQKEAALQRALEAIKEGEKDARRPQAPTTAVKTEIQLLEVFIRIQERRIIETQKAKMKITEREASAEKVETMLKEQIGKLQRELKIYNDKLEEEEKRVESLLKANEKLKEILLEYKNKLKEIHQISNI